MSTSGAASASLPSDARSNERPSPNAADFTSRKLPETQTDEPISPLVYWPSRPKNPDDGHISNLEQLRSFLRDQGVSVIIHGHKHEHAVQFEHIYDHLGERD